MNKQEGKAANTSGRFTGEGRRSCRQYLLGRGEATGEEHLEQGTDPESTADPISQIPLDPDSLHLFGLIIP